MDYEVAKLEEMDTWTKVDRARLPANDQVFPRMWVHLIKNLETGRRKFHSRWVV